MHLKNKVGIITGSSRGIGKATAIECCKQGATIVLNGRSIERLRGVERELRNQDFNVFAIQADITSETDCNQLIAETIRQYGRIDFLINNGSLTMNETVSSIDSATFKEVMISNSIGSIFPTLAALSELRKTKGSVVFISSLAGLHGMPSASAYSTGKMALTAFWQSLRIELANTGVHFGICYLGFTENDSEKRMLGANGRLKPVPKRPKYLQKSQSDVAKLIVKVIRKRKSKKMISLMGKVTAGMIRFFPGFTLFLLIRAEKRKNQNT